MVVRRTKQLTPNCLDCAARRASESTCSVARVRASGQAQLAITTPRATRGITCPTCPRRGEGLMPYSGGIPRQPALLPSVCAVFRGASMSSDFPLLHRKLTRGRNLGPKESCYFLLSWKRSERSACRVEAVRLARALPRHLADTVSCKQPQSSRMWLLSGQGFSTRVILGVPVQHVVPLVPLRGARHGPHVAAECLSGVRRSCPGVALK